VASDSGPARKYYEATQTGRALYRLGTDSWKRIDAALERLGQP
jgi:DNA-binding PadR family transcriptional regulator